MLEPWAPCVGEPSPVIIGLRSFLRFLFPPLAAAAAAVAVAEAALVAALVAALATCLTLFTAAFFVPTSPFMLRYVVVVGLERGDGMGGLGRGLRTVERQRDNQGARDDGWGFAAKDRGVGDAGIMLW